MDNTIYLLMIDHRHGANTSAHKTQEGALTALASYVAQEWEGEMPAGEAMPESEGEAIANYFHHMEGRESYDIEETELVD